MSAQAVIFGFTGLALSEAEIAFFRAAKPWGFILFARNCADPAQLRALCASLRDLTGRAHTTIFIDQEGGRVARLRPPHWRLPPAAAIFGTLREADAERGREAAYLNSRIIAHDLLELGINADCLPVLDVPHPGAHDIIGDRAYALDPHGVAELGRAAADGLIDGGVLPVIKHIPGHGRAQADSHEELPIVDASADDLTRIDFMPFRSLSAMPLAMTAHVVYSAIDPQRPATTSSKVIHNVIRGLMGFDGALMSDDLSMKALKGTIAERTKASFAAGCDLVLHCNGDMGEMEDVMRESRVLAGPALRRVQAAEAVLSRVPREFDRGQALKRLETLMGTALVA